MHRTAIFFLLALSGVPGAASEDFENALQEARAAAQSHHYGRALEILAPFSDSQDGEIRYVVAAEIGRARWSNAWRPVPTTCDGWRRCVTAGA